MSDSKTKALMVAGQCWCDPETSEIEMDARLANAFADRLAPLLDEIERLRLAYKEKLALEYARNACRIMATPLGCGDGGRAEEYAGVITGLLKRLGGER